MSSLFAQQPLSLRKTAAMLLVAVVLMLLDSKNPNWFASLRSSSHAAMQPIYQFSVFPSFVSHWGEGTLVSKESLRRENIKLQTQLLHAQAKLQQQDYILAQNARLQGILSTTKPDQYDLTLAQVIGTDSNPLKQIVVLNKGAQDGVKVGQTAIDENGILGQIINVYPNTSRLLLISDEQQSVAVTVKRTGQRAIVTGQGTPYSLSLDYIFKTSDIRVGDELVSSGLGGRMPAGYRVGRVAHIDTQQADNFVNIKVKPAANFVDNSFVLILQDKDLLDKEPATEISTSLSPAFTHLTQNPINAQNTNSNPNPVQIMALPQVFYPFTEDFYSDSHGHFAQSSSS